MTIKVSVKNDDSRENAIIEAVAVSAGTVRDNPGAPKQLKGGESAEFHVHSGQDLRISEIRNG